MSKIWETIMSFGGRQGKECYYILCMAISVAKEHQPERPQMKVVWAEVCLRANKKDPKTVSKALSRAVKDLWEFGNRERLAAFYCSWDTDENPPPQEFIYVVAQRLWGEENR